MPNSIETSRIAIPFVAEFDKQSPILMNSNTQFNKNFKAGNGSTIEIIVPPTNPTVKGEDLTGKIPAYANGKKSVTLEMYNQSVELGTLEAALELSSFEDQVAAPNAARMSSDMQSLAAEHILLNADSAVVVNSSTGSYADIGKALTNISKARATGAMFGALDPELADNVINSGSVTFQQDGGRFFTGELGNFRMAKWFQTADIPTLQTGARSDNAGTINGAISTNGASTIVIDALTDADEIKVGEVFKVAGCKMIDVYSNTVSTVDYAFVVQAPADETVDSGDWVAADEAYVVGTTTAGNVTLNIKPVYFTGALKNISATIADGAVVTFLTEGGATYNRGFVWSKQAFIVASAILNPLPDSKVLGQASGKVGGLLVEQGSDIVTRKTVTRWQMLMGFLLGRSNWCSSILVKA